MEILVLKTNIEWADLPCLKQKIAEIPTTQKWAIDLDDYDHILRIESLSENTLPIIIQEVTAFVYGLGLLRVQKCKMLDYFIDNQVFWY